jgi:type II secretory pathway component GspD/PulD (secretin)
MEGNPSLANVPSENQEALEVQEVAVAQEGAEEQEVAEPSSLTAIEAVPPEVAPIPATEPVPVLAGPADDLRSYVLAKPGPTKKTPVLQQKPPIPSGPIRIIDVELQDVKSTVATVLVKSDRPIVNYKSFTLSNPPRIVIDIQGAIDALPKKAKRVARGPIEKIRSSQYRKRPVGIARVVLVLSSKLPYLPDLPYRIQAAPGPLKIVVGEAASKPSGESLVAAEARKASAPAVRAPIQQRVQNLPGLAKRISVDLRQIDILAVMKFLAEEGDLNIATGKNVGGRVRLFLKNVSIRDVLDIIALTYELAYVVQNDIIHVMTEADYQRLFGSSFADQRQVVRLKLQYGDPASVAALLGNMKSAIGRVIADAQTGMLVLMDVPEKLEQMVAAAKGMDKATQMQTEVFELRYAKAEDIAPEVEKVITPQIGAVRLDKRTNTLVVTDLPPNLSEVRQVIGAFDRKTREVSIEAMILEVRLNDQYDVGVNWQRIFAALRDFKLQSQFPVVPPLASFGQIAVGTLVEDNFEVVIDALQAIGTTNVLSKPQISVVENEEASILVGTREAYVSAVVTQTQSASTTAEEIVFIDVGVQLKVTPSINQEGFVTMKIRPEVSAVTDTLVTAAGNSIPIVSTSTAETTVMVQDGRTIVIGGLMQDDIKEDTRKVPILGDIPVLKYMFQSWHEKVDKSELVIFLTPTIISGSESVSGVASVVRGKNDVEKETD